MREWMELFDEPRPSELPRSCIELLALFQQNKFMYTEVEVHPVYQRLIKEAGKGLHPMQHIPTYFACLSYFCIGYIQA